MSHSIGRFIQGGFSLVELMIAMTLGLVLVAGVAALSQNSSQIYRSLSGTSQQTENGRYAMQTLTEDLRHAGFFGIFNPNPSFAVSTKWTPEQQLESRQQQLRNALPATVPSPCTTDTANLATDLMDGFLLPVAGLNNPLTVPPDFSNCITKDTDLVSGADVLVIRRADTSVVQNTSDLQKSKGNAYIQTTIDDYAIGGYDSGTGSYTGLRRQGGVVNPVSNVTAEVLFNLARPLDGVTGEIRRYHVHVYYIRSWSVNPGDGIPTLVRSVLTNGGGGGNSPAMADEALVEGIENMQIQYGLDDDIDGTPDRYIDEPVSPMDWASVVAVRLNLLVRTLESDPTHIDSKTYTLGEGNIVNPPNDHFKRHVFSNVVKLENVSTRRECKQTLPLPAFCL